MNLFCVFYVPSYNSGRMTFSKRPGKNTPQCYTKPLDSLKNWNNRFFWVDEKVFPTVVAWRTAATKDDKPKANTYSVVDVATLDTHRRQRTLPDFGLPAFQMPCLPAAGRPRYSSSSISAICIDDIPCMRQENLKG
ncbi:hypothetical protein Tco_0793377 [Tanacetum coccineum]